MAKYQISVVMLWIWLKFWLMMPIGVKYNLTKFESENQRWRPRTEIASGGP